MTSVLLARTGTALAPDISIGHLLLQMVVALLIVVGAIWALGKLAARTRGARRGAKQPAGLHILSRQSIGKGKSVAVVEVGRQRFLVGFSGSGFTALGELRDESPTAAAVPASPTGATVLPSLTAATVPASPMAAAVPASLTAAAAPDAETFPFPDQVLATGLPGKRSLVDALREATVRR